MYDLDHLTAIFAGAVVITFILFGLIGCARALIDHWQEYRSLRDECEARRTQERKREARTMKRRTIGYLISDHAMELAKQVAALLGVNPLTQNDEFSRLCDLCKEALAGYDHRARQVNRRLNPLEEAFQLSLPEEG